MTGSYRSTPAFAIGGVEMEFRCLICGQDVGGVPHAGVRGICEQHCYDHDFEYDRYRHGHFCLHCDAEREYEPSEDDIPIYFGRAPGEPIGTPLSELAGRPDGTIEGQERYERFVEIGRSWGYD